MPSTPEVGFGFGVEGNQSLLAAIKQLRTEMVGLKSQQDGLASSALNLSNAWGTMVRLAGLLGLAKLGHDAYETALSIAKLSQITGVGAKTLSVYYNAADDVAVSHQAIDTSIRKLARSQQLLQEGNQEAVAGFARLGLSAKDFIGLSPDQALLKTTSALAKMEDGTKKAAAAQTLLGKGGMEAIPALNLLGSQYDELYRQTKALGLLMDNEMQASILRMQGSLADLKDSAEGAALQFETGLIPALADSADAMVIMVQGSDKGSNSFRKLGEWAGYLIKVLAEIVNWAKFAGLTITEFLGAALEQTGAQAIAVFGAIGAAVTGNFSEALNRLKTGFRESLDIGGSWWQHTQERFKTAIEVERTLVDNPNKHPARPGGGKGKGGDAPAAGAADLDRARAAGLKEHAQGELQIWQELARRKEAEDKRAYEQGLISLNEYFDRRAEAIRTKRADELGTLFEQKAELEQMLAKAEKQKAATPEDEIKRQRQLLELKQQIESVGTKAAQITLATGTELENNEAERARAVQEHKLKELEFEKQLAELQGNRARAAELTNQIEDRKITAELQQLGKTQAEIDKLLAQMHDARGTRAAGETAKEGFENKYSEFERKKAAIQEKGSGPDGEPAYQVERELAELYRSEIPILQEKLNLLRQAAELARQQGNTGQADDMTRQADDEEGKLIRLQSELTQMDVSWMQWKTTAKQSIDEVSQQMTTGLNGWIQGQQSFGQAVAQTWNSMVMTGIQAAEKIAAHWIASQLKMLLFKRTTDAAMTASTAAHGAQQQALEKRSGLRVVFTNAKVAASKAYKAHAENPILAAAMAALAFTSTMAFAAFQTGGVVDKRKHSPMASFAGARSFRGSVSGPAGIDRVPAYLTHGESVLTTGATRVLGEKAINAFNGGDFSSLQRAVFLPPLREAAPYSRAGLALAAGAPQSFASGSGRDGGVHFNHTTNIDGLQALDGASVRAALEEHGDLIGDMAVAAVRNYMRQNGVNR
jgi:hypothetical protein